MADQAIFDPFLLPGDVPRPIEVQDQTDEVALLRYDALGGLISIPGVEGGIMLALQGDLEASYQTERIVVTNADPIEYSGHETTYLDDPDASGLGESVTIAVHPEGTLDYDGVILAIPQLYIEVLGSRFDYDLFEVPIPIVRSSPDIVFDDVVVDVPLPDVDLSPGQIDFGQCHVGESVVSRVWVTNDGLADLEIAPQEADGPFSITPSGRVIPPGETRPFTVRYAPETTDSDAVMLFFETNDPDEPLAALTVLGQGLPARVYDAGSEDEADALPPDGDMETEYREGRGCDCAVSGSSPGERTSLASLVLSLLRALLPIS